MLKHLEPLMTDGWQSRRPLEILVAVDAGLSPAGTVWHAAIRAEEAAARLTVLCAWRSTSLLGFASFAGMDPTALFLDEERRASVWLRHRTLELPEQLSVQTRLVCGCMRTHLARQIAESDYDKLFVDHATSPRAIRRVRATRPELAIVSLTQGRRPAASSPIMRRT